ncbi:hypothetical protein [Caviibacterium pharyngocola]|uniref:Uracil-DNA glycosylase n=1 Tax=Caviibacterium pharyngocola TaxID=28159 RepID=A0A2M8RX16_9PAST|nr:hypothetical protein [Caviibacterium pharyngocola]PJG83435.1 hypothetical protein CVP04_04740 [Caviibacterium pharyngocola]
MPNNTKTISDLYNAEPNAKLYDDLQNLFREWKDTLKESSEKEFVEDGFYSFYTVQKKKILFIGREALDMEGSYTEEMLKRYREGAYSPKNQDKKSVSSSAFHRRIIKLAKAFQIAEGTKEFPEWDSLDSNKLAQEIGTEADKLSFAFMNLSKYSNDSGHYSADWALINSFIEGSNTKDKNFFEEQIKLLDPDIIVIANFAPETLGKAEIIAKVPNDSVHLYKIEINGKEIPLFNTYHFSAVISEEDKFYNAIKELYLAYLEKNRFM